LDKGKSSLQIFNAGISFERVQMDVLGPLPTSQKQILIGDYGLFY